MAALPAKPSPDLAHAVHTESSSNGNAHAAAEQQLSVEGLLHEAKKRWLKGYEVLYILENYRACGYSHNTEVVQNPQSGSVFLYWPKTVKYRRDGIEWRKKKVGKGIQEDHEKLRVGGQEVLRCCYVHSEENKNFHRRAYNLLNNKDLTTLVHYLEEKDEKEKVKPKNKTTAQSMLTTSLDGKSEVRSNSNATNTSSPLPITSNSHVHNMYSPQQLSSPLGSPHMLMRTTPTSRLQLALHPPPPPPPPPPEHSTLYSAFVAQLMAQQQQSPLPVSVVPSVHHPNPNVHMMHPSPPEERRQRDEEPWLDELMSSTAFDASRGQVQPQTQLLPYIPFSYLGDTFGGHSTQTSEKESISLPQYITPSQGLNSIKDFSPEWDYTQGGAKLLITGDAFQPLNGYANDKGCYYCMFDTIEVPAEVVQPGVLRCFVPPHSAGVVPFCVTLGNGTIFSELKQFEYRNKEIPQHDQLAWLNMTEQDFKLGLLKRLEALENNLKGSSSLHMEDISSVNMHTEHQFDSTNEKIYQLFERVLLRLMDFMNNTLNDSDRKMHVDFIDEHGLCMLDYLSALNYPRCLTILLQSGATVDIHKHAKRKFSVLHVAVKSAHFGVLKLLVEKGKADLFAMNEYAETPLDFAIRREYKDIVYYLREKMQDSLSFKAEQDEDQPNTEREDSEDDGNSDTERELEGSLPRAFIDSMRLRSDNDDAYALFHSPSQASAVNVPNYLSQQEAERGTKRKSLLIEDLSGEEDHMDFCMDFPHIMQDICASGSSSVNEGSCNYLEESAALRIQSVFRGHRLKKRNEAATTIQKAYRKRYEKRNGAAQTIQKAFRTYRIHKLNGISHTGQL